MRYTFLQDISSYFLGYTHHGHSVRRNETRKEEKVEGSTIGCCVMYVMRYMSRNIEEIESVLPLPLTRHTLGDANCPSQLLKLWILNINDYNCLVIGLN